MFAICVSCFDFITRLWCQKNTVRIVNFAPQGRGAQPGGPQRQTDSWRDDKCAPDPQILTAETFSEIQLGRKWWDPKWWEWPYKNTANGKSKPFITVFLYGSAHHSHHFRPSWRSSIRQLLVSYSFACRRFTTFYNYLCHLL